MSMISMPRAFSKFDPAMHVAKPTGEVVAVDCVMVGIDIGSAAPCVALHGALFSDGSMRVMREVFEPGLGLELFVDGGAIGEPDSVDMVCAERAVVAKSPITNRSAKMVLEEGGHRVLVCKSSPQWRMNAINTRLGMGAGKGGIVVDPSCVHLLAALIGHRQVFGERGKYRCSTPRYQHAVDAFGYLVEGFARWMVCQNVECSGLCVDLLA